jgi:signal transduction histidine kinase
VPLRPAIEQLLELSDDELRNGRAAELEDAVQRGLSAVHVGELWISQLRRALVDTTSEEDKVAIEQALAASRASVREVRREVAALHERAQELGIGAPVAS